MTKRKSFNVNYVDCDLPGKAPHSASPEVAMGVATTITTTSSPEVIWVEPKHSIGDFPDWSHRERHTILPYVDPYPHGNPYKVDTTDPSEGMAEIIKRAIEGAIPSSSNNVRRFVAETDSRYYVRLELPGVSHSDVNVSKEGSVITVTVMEGDSAFEEDQILEDNSTTFYDGITVEIPAHVDPNPVSLIMKNGMLRLEFKLASAVSLDVEDQDPNLLKEAVEEMNED